MGLWLVRLTPMRGRSEPADGENIHEFMVRHRMGLGSAARGPVCLHEGSLFEPFGLGIPSMDSGEVNEIVDALGEVDLDARRRIGAVVERLGIGAARGLVDHAFALERSEPSDLPSGIHASNLSGLFLQLASAELAAEAYQCEEDTKPGFSLPPPSSRDVTESTRRRISGDTDVAKSMLKAVLDPFDLETRRAMLTDLLDALDRRAPRQVLGRVKLRP